MILFWLFKQLYPWLQKVGQQPSLWLWTSLKMLSQLEKNFTNFLEEFFVVWWKLKLNNYINKNTDLLSKPFYNIDPGLWYFSYIPDWTLIIDKNLINVYASHNIDIFNNFFYEKVFKHIEWFEWWLSNNPNFSKLELELLFYSIYLNLSLKSPSDLAEVWTFVFSARSNMLSIIPAHWFTTSTFRKLFYKNYGEDKFQRLQLVNINFEQIKGIIKTIEESIWFNVKLIWKYLDSMLLNNDPTVGLLDTYQYMKDMWYTDHQNMKLLAMLWKISFVKDNSWFVGNLFWKKNDKLEELHRTLVDWEYNLDFNEKITILFFLSIDIIYSYYLLIKSYKEYANKYRYVYSNHETWEKWLKFFNKEYYLLLEYLWSNYKIVKDTLASHSITQETFDKTINQAININMQCNENIFSNNINIIVEDQKNLKHTNKVDEVINNVSQDTNLFVLDNSIKNKPISNEPVTNNEIDNYFVSDNKSENKTNSWKISFLDIYNKLKEKIKWQDELLYMIAKKIHSYIFLKKENSSPLNLFFMWPPGTGKTYLSTVLKDVLNEFLWQEEKFIAQKEQMENYTSKESLTRLIWASKWYVWYWESINLFENMLNGKNQIILFDEIEKWPKEFFTFLLNFMNDWQLNSMDEQYSIQMWDSPFDTNAKKKHKLSNVILLFSSNTIHNIDQINELFNLKWKDKINLTRDIEEYETKFNDYHSLFRKSLIKKNVDSAFVDRLHWIFMFHNLSDDSIKDILEHEFQKQINTFDLSDDDKKLIYNQFNLEYLSWVWFKELMKIEWMRWLKNFISDWISSFIQKNS